MSVIGVDYVQLAMPPGGEAVARFFYGDALGLSEVEKPAHLQQRGACWFEGGTARVHLGVEGEFRPARKAHPAFLVRDLAAMVERLSRSGYQVRTDAPLAGYRRVYVDDPFGNRDRADAAGSVLVHAPGALPCFAGR